MEKKDYYKILEVNKTAQADEIKKSYRKLALQYHPDRNPTNKIECEEKFKLIGEAYTVLSNDDKRRQYDMMGDISLDDDDEMNDPFSVFNNIFEKHMNQFMNMQYEDDINVGNILNSISGGKTCGFPFGNVHVSVHTFSNDPSVFQSINFKNSNSNPLNQDHNEYDDDSDEDEENPIKNIGSNISSIFSNFFKKKEVPRPSHRPSNFESPSKVKIMYNKPESTIYTITVSLSDVFNFKKKKVTIIRKRIKNNKYINSKKKVRIPLYAKELLLENEGDEVVDYKEKGDAVINISYKPHKNCTRINDYDVLIKKEITLQQIYTAFTYELTLPNGNILHIEAEKLSSNKDLIQKIENKGIPYDDNHKVNYGAIFVLYQVKYPDSLDELKTSIDSFVSNESTNNPILDIEYNKAINCSINEIFSD